MNTYRDRAAIVSLRVLFVVPVVVLSLSVFAGRVGAETISLNYRSTDTQNGNPGDYVLSPTDVAGVVAVDHWNDAQHSNLQPSFDAFNLMDNNGVGTTADLTLISSNGAAGPGQGVSGVRSNDNRMLLSPKAIGTNAGPAAPSFTLTLNGAEIPFAIYDVLVYLTDQRSNAENTSVEATLGDTTYYLQTPDNDEIFFANSGFVVSADTVDDGDFNNDVANYVRFAGVTGDSFSIELVATQGNTVSDSSRLGIGGVQITQAIPEPSTLALAALGLLGLLGFGRRGRK
ncbi:MAG: PEP-CTERM sorting domain-containing protein [Planctomycetes bacterium]|nr:PEP-CTERM sorting domain-containing protein [Planctomycetota bacterium]